MRVATAGKTEEKEDKPGLRREEIVAQSKS
jgi:hypothetical protein